jgi:hypothetical protein
VLLGEIAPAFQAVMLKIATDAVPLRRAHDGGD